MMHEHARERTLTRTKVGNIVMLPGRTTQSEYK